MSQEVDLLNGMDSARSGGSQNRESTPQQQNPEPVEQNDIQL